MRQAFSVCSGSVRFNRTYTVLWHWASQRLNIRCPTPRLLGELQTWHVGCSYLHLSSISLDMLLTWMNIRAGLRSGGGCGFRVSPFYFCLPDLEHFEYLHSCLSTDDEYLNHTPPADVIHNDDSQQSMCWRVIGDSCLERQQHWNLFRTQYLMLMLFLHHLCMCNGTLLEMNVLFSLIRSSSTA